MSTIHLPKVNFNQEQVTEEIIKEISPMLNAHFKEIARFQDIPLDPCFDTYVQNQEANSIRLYTVRDQGKLIGYQVLFLRYHPHYRKSLQAYQDLIYISPEYRGAKIGTQFIEWCDGKLREDGVQVVYAHVNSLHNFSKMLVNLNYSLIDLTYAKRLDLF